MRGENRAQIGGTAKAYATHSSIPSALSMLVSAGSQNPVESPWKKETSQSLVKIPLPSVSFSTDFR